jgi:hypothetical protein
VISWVATSSAAAGPTPAPDSAAKVTALPWPEAFEYAGVSSYLTPSLQPFADIAFATFEKIRCCARDAKIIGGALDRSSECILLPPYLEAAITADCMSMFVDRQSRVSVP